MKITVSDAPEPGSPRDELAQWLAAAVVRYLIREAEAAGKEQEDG